MGLEKNLRAHIAQYVTEKNFPRPSNQFLRLYTIIVINHLFSFSENGRANPYYIGSLFHGYLPIAAHTHRKTIESSQS